MSPALDPPSQRRSARIEEWIAYNWDAVAGGLSVLCVGAVGLIPIVWPDWHDSRSTLLTIALLAGGAVLFILGVGAGNKKKTQLDDAILKRAAAERELSELEHELSEWQLSSLAVLERLCELFVAAMYGAASERVSVYRHTGKGYFVRLARFSGNPKFASSGRTKYPEDQGVVGEAWTNGSAKQTVTVLPGANRQGWINAIADVSGIPKKTLAGMAMESRVLLAHRIEDEAQHRPCAVLVFESTRTHQDLESRCDPVARFAEIVQGDLGVALTQAVSILARLQADTDPDVAQQRGF